MKSVFFRPMLGLSLFTLIGLAILISLGVWQSKRLAWKTDLLREIEQASHEAPITQPQEIIKLLEKGEFVEFRRVTLYADIVDMPAPFFVFTARNRDLSWRRFQIIKAGPHYFFAELGIVPDAQRESFVVQARQNTPIFGYIRTASWQEPAHSVSRAEKNRWFGFNPLTGNQSWSKLAAYPADDRFFIETVPSATSGQDLPPKQPDIANNHFDYMLTWFALAIILFIFYILIHIKNGRIGVSAPQ